MDKGQHLRLFIKETVSSTTTSYPIAMATSLSLHGSAQTENSTTKDTTDASGAVWDDFEITGRSADISFSGLIAAGTDADAKTFNDMLQKVNDTLIDWEICMASGEMNRVKGQTICYGKGKLTNIQATGQVNQQASYSGTINVWGPMTPGTIQ